MGGMGGAKRRVLRWLVPAGIVLALAAPAGARSLEFRGFDVDVRVLPDASITVTERLTVQFNGSWNGIYRSIPVRYNTPQGFSFDLRLRVVGVTDDDGEPLRYEVERERHYRKIKMWVPGANDAVRTILLHYKVDNALGYFEDHDELYWNVTGDEWDFPVGNATARITLPSGASEVRAIAFTGAYGSRAQNAEVSVEGQEISVQTVLPLEYREGMTVVVGWAKGLVDEPDAVDKAAGFVRSNWPLVIPVIVFFIMFRLWHTRGRDPRLRPIAVAYEPPDNLSPAEVGTLIDDQVDVRDITSTVIDLAVRGYILIEETEKEQFLGLISSRDYVFRSLKPAGEWATLRPHEHALLGALFSHGSRESIHVSELQNKFYKHLPGLREQVLSGLMSRKYYRSRPDRTKAAYIGGGLVISIIMGAGLLVMSDSLGIGPIVGPIVGIVSFGIIVIFGRIMPARTESGTRALEGVMGFEEFLDRVESDKLERVEMTPQLFEKFLPYAMALGVEKNWSKAFEKIYTTPPQWYHGTTPGGMFRTHLLASSLANMSGQTASAMSSAPRSRSGGSGFGGGGSSGGGGGGGGGGGF